MEKDTSQNTTEFKITDTAEIRAVENADAQNDNYSEKSTKKQNVIAIIVCVVIAFIIWLIIANINMDAVTPAPLPAFDGEFVAGLGGSGLWA
jgi:uncharacterized integral membrane protein